MSHDRADPLAETGIDLEWMLQRVSWGDAPAFGELYDVIAPRVLGLVTRVLVDRSQAEEVTQEVFLELWQSASRFDPNRGSATTWVLTMARRRAVDRVRSAQAAHDRDVKVGIRDAPREFDEVAEAAEVRVEHKRAEEALAALPEAQRIALRLAYYGGYSQSEIAERLGLPLGTVKTRLRDGMIRLRSELGVGT